MITGFSRFSNGINKAFVVVTEGSLLGHKVGRLGASVEPERTAAIVDFAPLKDITHLRQFLGCTNWIRHYLPVVYPVTVKLLADYMNPGAAFSRKRPGGRRRDDGR